MNKNRFAGTQPKPAAREIVWPTSEPKTLVDLTPKVGTVLTRTGQTIVVALPCLHWATPSGHCRHECEASQAVSA